MENESFLYIAAAVLVMAAATQFTRAFPFVIFSRRRPPEWFIRSARLIPGAVMMVLVLTALPWDLRALGSHWQPWAAGAAAALLHLTLRQPLVSIFGSTGLYMLLIHLTGTTPL